MFMKLELNQAEGRLADLVDKALDGEEVIIEKNERQAVRLMVVDLSKSMTRRLGTAKGLVKIAEDFDAPLDDFREYS